MRRRRRRNKNKFWRIYGIAVGAAVLVILCGLGIFYDFMGAYEASQPQNVADGYLINLTEEKITDMASAAVEGLSMKYEDPEEYIGKYRKAWSENIPVCQKLLTESSSERPVYSVMGGDVEVCRLTLTESGSGSYGFQKWVVESCEFPVGSLTDGGTEYSVYAPAGASVTVNGISLTDPAGENVPCPIVSELEAELLCSYYDLGTLYSEPEIVCTADFGECVIMKREGVILCAQPGSAVKDYTVVAPGDASVYVNDVLLGEEYVREAGLPYEYSEFEENADGLPTQTVYRTGELFTEPSVKVILGETEARVSRNEDNFFAAYPESLMYSLTVRVPKGSSVSINGMAAGEPDSTERAFAGLLAETVAVPEYDVYSVTGMFSPVQSVTGALDGTELEFTSVTEDGKQEFTSDHSSVIDGAVSEFAMDFTKAYFHYTSEGYRNIDANLAAALAYVAPGSELYQKIRDSKIGYDFVTPVTRETFNRLEVTGAYSLEDGSSVIKIAFDVDQTVVYVDRTYAGEIFLHITGTGDGRKVSAMVIDSE